MKQALKVKCTLEPWIKALLTNYMQVRYDKSYSKFNMSKDQCKLIDSLYISWRVSLLTHLFLYLDFVSNKTTMNNM